MHRSRDGGVVGWGTLWDAGVSGAGTVKKPTELTQRERKACAHQRGSCASRLHGLPRQPSELTKCTGGVPSGGASSKLQRARTPRCTMIHVLLVVCNTTCSIQYRLGKLGIEFSFRRINF